MLRLAALSALALLSAAAPARAAFLVSGSGGGNNSQVLSNQQFTFGYEFTVGAQALSVTRLGILDLDFIGPGNGLYYSHQVGIWTTGGDLVASVTVPAGAPPLVNGFRYADLGSAVQLAAGQNYIVGAHYANPDGAFQNDFLKVNSTAQMQSVISADVTYMQGRFASGAFGFPGSATSNGYIGANFEYNVASSGGGDPGAAVAPAPSGLAVALSAAPALGLLLRRRRGAAQQ